MQKVIVYGGAGFIGSAIVKQLCENNIETWVIEKEGITETESYRRICNLPIHLIECNLDNVEHLEEYVKEQNFDTFYQLAWGELDNESLLKYKKQIHSTEMILKSIIVAKKMGCRRFIGAGSITENELLHKEGRNFVQDKHKYYRAAQFMCNTMGRGLASELGIEFFWPQIINVYGPGELSERLVNTLIRKLISGESMELSAGEQLYDFLYITDAANAFFLIGEKGIAGEEYIIGSGQPRNLKDYLNCIVKIIDETKTIGLGKLKYNGLYMTEEQFHIDALNQIGFQPQVSFEEGIHKTKEWIINYDNR